MNKLPNLFAERSLRHRPGPSADLGGKSGQALIIVLGFVMLMTVLILVFFQSVITEKTSSKAAASGQSARQLAQSAVQLVEATITQATVPTYDTTIAWASQPGMIRTYGTPSGTAGTPGTPSSKPLAYYKLYSSSNMVTNFPSTYSVDADVTAGGDLLSNWSSVPALYTDLNAPTTASDGSLVFPIADPRASSVNGSTPVDGFGYQNFTPPTSGRVTLNSADFGASSSLSSGIGQGTAGSLLPMPVQWIYVLRDGTLTSPKEPTADPAPATNVADFGGVANAPTANNPIVGRFGYWTDDETSKINLNTASEGTYMDTPIANSGLVTNQFSYPVVPFGGDANFAMAQGAQHEFQRYPGHPATTCLSEVFGSSISPPARTNVVATITTASPRYTDLDTPDTTGSTTLDSSLGGTQNPTATVPLKFDRLYASVDDFNFAAPTVTPPSSRAPQGLTTSPTTTQQLVAQSRFFLTTSDKASDLNPFGLPKISIWPIWDDTNSSKRSPLDQAILKASTLNAAAASGSQHRMIFVRQDPTSPTTDCIPISPAVGLDLDPSGSLPRNQELYQYLQSLTGGNVSASPLGIPGFGGNFTTKYGVADRDQILTEIYDYIRCVNLSDTTVAAADAYTPSSSVGQVVPIQITAPTSGTSTQGFGRIATIAELGICFDKMDDRMATTQTVESPYANSITVTGQGSPVEAGQNPSYPTSITPGSGSTNQSLVEWALLPRLFSPACGYVALANNIRVHFTNITLKITDTSASPTTNTYTYTNTLNAAPTQISDMYITGVIPGGRDAAIGGEIGIQALENGTTSADSMLPTGLFAVKNGTNTFTFSGSITAQILAPASVAIGSEHTVQTLNFVIPSTTVPLPTLNLSGTKAAIPWRAGVIYSVNSSTGVGTLTYPDTTLAQLTSKLGGTNGNRIDPSQADIPFYYGYDVVRSLVSTGTLQVNGNTVSVDGDMRDIAACKTTVSSGSGGYNMTLASNGVAVPTSQVQASTMRMGNGVVQWAGFSAGLLFQTNFGNGGGANAGPGPEVPMLPVPSAQASEPNGAPAQMTNTLDVSGGVACPADWDNGQGMMPDGPYINKPDEGAGLPETMPPATFLGQTIPYIGSYTAVQSGGAPTKTLFSANRQISSPVVFGSLSAGLDHPWRTLLFRPATLPGYQQLQVGASPGYYTHPGGASPPDHLLLDFFRMPIVEPYSMSDAVSAAGKVNLNTQIAPFTYITRTTGLRAVLKSVMITALNPSTTTGVSAGGKFISSAKTPYYNGQLTTTTTNTSATRYPIDLNDTINLMTTLNDNNSNGATAFPEFLRTSHTATAPNFFVSPSQICDLPLIPTLPAAGSNAGISGPITTLTGAAGSNSLQTFWAANGLTGDNSLERPYTCIYPRVTTQSNTFTVHVRAQSLQKLGTGLESATTWTEGTDQVTGEYRGSFTVEKYFDPTNATITDASNPPVVQNDAADASLPTTAAVRGALWRLLYDKRFGQ